MKPAGCFSMQIPIALFFLVMLQSVQLPSAHAKSGIPDSIAKAFLESNPDILHTFLSPKTKISASVPTAGLKPGNYTKSQLTAAMRLMFRKCKTLDFSLKSAQKDVVRAVWTFRKSGRVIQTTLYFTVSMNHITAVRGQ